MLHTQADSIGRPGAAGHFLARRFIRIVPMYWVCTCAIICLHEAGLSFTSTQVTLTTVVQSLLFIPSDTIILGVGWTLKFEMYFYLLFAIFLGLSVSGSPLFLLPALVGVLIGASVMFGSDALRAFATDPIALEFCFGMAVAAIFARAPPSRRSAMTALILGSVGLVLGSAFGPSAGTAGLDRSVRYALWGIPSTALLWAALRPSRFDSSVGRLLLFFGDASYSIYLTHAFVMIAYAHMLKSGHLAGAPPVVVICIVVCASIGLGCLTYRLLERPMSRLLNTGMMVRHRTLVKDVRMIR